MFILQANLSTRGELKMSASTFKSPTTLLQNQRECFWPMKQLLKPHYNTSYHYVASHRLSLFIGYFAAAWTWLSQSEQKEKKSSLSYWNLSPTKSLWDVHPFFPYIPWGTLVAWHESAVFMRGNSPNPSERENSSDVILNTAFFFLVTDSSIISNYCIHEHIQWWLGSLVLSHNYPI